ncbi:MAG: CAP domain-containing protein [bacterium]
MRKRTLVIALCAASMTLLASACGGEDGNNVPSNAYCDPVSDWSSEWIAWESRMLDLFNQARGVGADCGGEYFGPTHALEIDPALRCASRAHSKDMSDRDFFDHTNPDGEGPADRFARAGYTGGGWGENIVGGYGSADAQFDGWMDSPGHCSNIMNPGFTVVGIGFFHGPGSYGDLTTAGFGSY